MIKCVSEREREREALSFYKTKRGREMRNMYNEKESERVKERVYAERSCSLVNLQEGWPSTLSNLYSHI